MARETYLEHLEKRLGLVDAKIAKARARHDKGAPREKVETAGELALLEAKHQELSKKIKDAADHHAEDWSVFHTETQEDLDALLEALDRWITHHS
jgi:hypothetical protein